MRRILFAIVVLGAIAISLGSVHVVRHKPATLVLPSPAASTTAAASVPPAPLTTRRPPFLLPPQDAGPPAPRTAAQLAIDSENACTGPTGKWLCDAALAPKTMRASLGPVVNPPAWSVPNWYIDPVNGSDNNNCTAASGTGGVGPCKTCAQIVQARWGTRTPSLGQATTIGLLSNMAVGDSCNAAPVGPYDGTEPAPSFNIVGTFVPYFTTSITTYNQRVRCTATDGSGACTGTGTLGTITNVGVNWSTACAGSGAGSGSSCVGAMVRDNVTNVGFAIEADQGSGVATISTPFALPVTAFGAEGTPVNGDTISVGHMPAFNDNAISGTVSAVQTTAPWITMGNAATLQESYVGNNGFVLCGTNGVNACVLGSDVFPGYAAAFGSVAVTGGIFLGPNSLSAGEGSVLDGDTVLIVAAPFYSGSINVASAYFAGGCETLNPPWHIIFVVGSYSSTPFLWGPGSMCLVQGSTAFMQRSTFTASLLLTGGLTIEGTSSGGWAFNGDGTFHGPYSVSSTTLDQHCGLSDPATSAAFITSQLCVPSDGGGL